MAYNEKSYTTVAQSKAAAQQAKAYADRVGGIQKISVNGTEMTVGADKSVNIVVSGSGTVDLSGYVQKEDGKGLSTKDYTAEDKAKLDSMQAATDAEFAEMLGEVFPAEKA